MATFLSGYGATAATLYVSAAFTMGYDREYFTEQIAGMAAIIDECKVDEDEAIAMFIKAINERPKRAK